MHVYTYTSTIDAFDPIPNPYHIPHIPTTQHNREGLPLYIDRLGRLYLVVASLYWLFKYLPGVVEDYGAKNGDVSAKCWGGDLTGLDWTC
jgi:hypothetical protein